MIEEATGARLTGALVQGVCNTVSLGINKITAVNISTVLLDREKSGRLDQTNKPQYWTDLVPYIPR